MILHRHDRPVGSTSRSGSDRAQKEACPHGPAVCLAGPSVHSPSSSAIVPGNRRIADFGFTRSVRYISNHRVGVVRSSGDRSGDRCRRPDRAPRERAGFQPTLAGRRWPLCSGVSSSGSTRHSDGEIPRARSVTVPPRGRASPCPRRNRSPATPEKNVTSRMSDCFPRERRTAWPQRRILP